MMDETYKQSIKKAFTSFKIDEQRLIDDIAHCKNVIDSMPCNRCCHDHERLLRYMQFVLYIKSLSKLI